MKEHLCIGGPFDKQHIDWDVAREHDYVQFNCASGGAKTAWAKRDQIRRGQIPVPSMVYLHRTLFADNEANPVSA